MRFLAIVVLALSAGAAACGGSDRPHLARAIPTTALPITTTSTTSTTTTTVAPTGQTVPTVFGTAPQCRELVGGFAPDGTPERDYVVVPC